MNMTYLRTEGALRRCWMMASIFAFSLTSLNLCQAGMLVGTGAGNDSKPNVVAVINAYNSVNDPDLPTDIELFKKTDDDAGFVFNLLNGFQFFSDAAGTIPVLTENDLTALDGAYFSYSGPANLLYYSVKGGPDFKVYTYMPGLNFIEAPPVPGGGPAAISHVSFWVPEPSSCVSLLMGGFALLLRRRS